MFKQNMFKIFNRLKFVKKHLKMAKIAFCAKFKAKNAKFSLKNLVKISPSASVKFLAKAILRDFALGLKTRTKGGVYA